MNNIPYSLISCILIAKSILDENPNMITSIQHDRQYLGHTKFDMNDKVKMHTAIRPLIQIVKSELRKATGFDNITLKIFKVDTGVYKDGENRISGIMMKEREDKYTILLNEGETYCTQRLSLCKELCQIHVGSLLKDTTVLSPNNQIIEAARELISKFYSTHNPQIFAEFESSETFAHSVALELMIPYTLREEIQKDIEGGKTIFDIAQRLFITEETLTRYMREYFDITTPIYDLL